MPQYSALCWDGGLNNFWPWIASNHDPPDLCLPSSYDYRSELPHQASQWFFRVVLGDLVKRPFDHLTTPYLEWALSQWPWTQPSPQTQSSREKYIHTNKPLSSDCTGCSWISRLDFFVTCLASFHQWVSVETGYSNMLTAIPSTCSWAQEARDHRGHSCPEVIHLSQLMLYSWWPPCWMWSAIKDSDPDDESTVPGRPGWKLWSHSN
jgi:hypothetical protein